MADKQCNQPLVYGLTATQIGEFTIHAVGFDLKGPDSSPMECIFRTDDGFIAFDAVKAPEEAAALFDQLGPKARAWALQACAGAAAARAAAT